jgi:lipase
LIGPVFYEVNGERLAVWERPGAGSPILFAHATGMHAHCWNQIVEQLPGRHCIALDMRGHGLSSKPEPPYYWSRFGADVAALAQQMGLRGIIGAGHSMGGHSITFAAILNPAIFSRLFLIDAVILPPHYYTGHSREVHFARRRRNRWHSPQEMFDRFAERPPFNLWDRAILRDYCDYGLLPAPDGDGYVLACPPDVEGSIYENSGQCDANLYGRIGEVEAEVTVVRSGRLMPLEGPMEMGSSPTAPDLASKFKHAADLEIKGSHFIPMESPALIVELLDEVR